MIIRLLVTSSNQVKDLAHKIPPFHTARLINFSYKEITSGQRSITVFISGLNDKINVDDDKRYFFSSLMPTFANAFVSYQSQHPKQYDYVNRVHKAINQIRCSIEIDGEFSADISPSNPVMMEIEFL